jgi:hypothetical protein
MEVHPWQPGRCQRMGLRLRLAAACNKISSARRSRYFRAMPKIDTLTAMKARRQITVDRYRAARRWQALQAQADDIVLAR